MPTSTRILLTGAACALAAALPVPRAHADTLNWGTSGYTYNAATQVGTTGTGGTVATVNGNTVSILYNTGSYFNNSYNNTTNQEPSPGVGTNNATTTLYTDGGTNNGTQGTGSQALQIFANFDDAANKLISGAGISVTVFFSKPVSSLMFSFWDVDTSAGGSANPYVDVINNLSGKTASGLLIAPLTITNGAANPASTAAPNGAANTYSIGTNSASITGTGSAIQGAGTPGTGLYAASGGKSTVQFGSTPITSFTFTYTDNSAAGSTHSTIQIMGLSDLQFTTVPEPSTWACFAVAGGLGAWTLRRRARRTA